MDRWSRRLASGWPLIAAIVLLGAIVAAGVWSASAHTGQRFVYPIDDPYIHLALARHLVETGVVGVNPGEFSFATSSYLWTALLAAGHLLAPGVVWVPFAFSCAFALILVGLARRVLTSFGFSTGQTAFALVMGVTVTALPAQIFLGMEHVAHAAIVLAILYYVDRQVHAQGRPPSIAALGVLLAVGMLVRFETIFLAVPIGLYMLRERDLRSVVVLALIAGLPLLAVGVYASIHGAYLVPNSVLIKKHSVFPSDPLAVESYIRAAGAFAHKLREAPVLTVLIGWSASWLFLLRRAGRHEPEATRAAASRANWWAAMFLAGATLHLLFSQVGWAFRYQYYLVQLGVVVSAVQLRVFLSTSTGRGLLDEAWGQGDWLSRALCVFLAALTLSLGGYRAFQTTSIAATGSRGQHAWHIQAARFLDEFYRGKTVAFTDIGAESYFARSTIVDLTGLGTNEVARARLEGRADASFYADIVAERGVELVAISHGFPDHDIPPEWTLVGHFYNPHRVMGAFEMFLYAPRPEYAPVIARQLEAFRPQLPADLTVRLESGAPRP